MEAADEINSYWNWEQLALRRCDVSNVGQQCNCDWAHELR